MQVEEKNRQLNKEAETIEEKNELQSGKKKHRKNNFAAGMAVGAAAAIKAANKTGEIGVYSIDASPDGKQALLDGEFTAVACQVPLRSAENSSI